MIEFRLLSSNPQGISADVILSVSDGRQIIRSDSKRVPRVVCPFECIARQRIHRNRFVIPQGDLQLNGPLIVTADLKNIAPHEELYPSRIDLWLIDVEIIEFNSIKSLLNSNRSFGIASPMKTRNCSVYSSSSVSLWSRQNPDCRYWLCRRFQDGQLLIRFCLNETDPLLSFQDLIREANESESMITLFKEEKNSNESFQLIDEDTIILLLKLYEPSQYNDLTYLGPIQVQKTTACLDLLEAIAIKLPDRYDRDGYNAYVEEGGYCLQEITNQGSTLDKSGLHSGSVIIIREKGEPSERVNVQTVEQELRKNHTFGPEFQNCTPPEFVSDVKSESDSTRDPVGRPLAPVTVVRSERGSSSPRPFWRFVSLAASVVLFGGLMYQQRQITQNLMAVSQGLSLPLPLAVSDDTSLTVNKQHSSDQRMKGIWILRHAFLSFLSTGFKPKEVVVSVRMGLEE